MAKNRTRIILITAAILAAMFLLTHSTRNQSFEFCTAKAYGSPFPWSYDGCECMKGANYSIFDWFGNLVIALLIAFVANWFIGKLVTSSQVGKERAL